jgi:carbamoyl-phosphate synthase large subunit
VVTQFGIPQPASGTAVTLDEALAVAREIGYPLMVRPSYVLGGRGMEVVYDDAMLTAYVNEDVDISPGRPILIYKFLENDIETEADAIADGTDAFVPSVMEHIELAGVHSGDSACAIPPKTLPEKHIKTINEYTKRIAIELNVVGLMNISTPSPMTRCTCWRRIRGHLVRCRWSPRCATSRWRGSPPT